MKPLKADIKPESVYDISFEIVTDVYPSKKGKKFAKRKAVFLHHLKKYFNVAPKQDEKY